MADELRPFNTTIERPAGHVIKAYGELATTAISDIIDLSCVMHHTIHPLWPDIRRIAGPAFTVRTGRYDNLMLHSAIYLAQPGDVIVVESPDDQMAVAGGNVCAIAKRRGIAGFVIDGVIRDIGESRENDFPLFARGITPIPGKRGGAGDINATIRCGGVVVNPGDVVVADSEGIVVIPRGRADDVLSKAHARLEADAKLTLDQWEARHRANVEAALKTIGRRL
jgi:regulator of RNase E activity RraA